jgi:acetylornithine deacetylase/succinyl-diaminopimelate desuccinylase-like protein
LNYLDFCKKFIAADSTPTAGTKESADVFIKDCRDRGLVVKVFENYESGLEQRNVMVTLKPADEIPKNKNFLLLQGHLDTAEPGPFNLWEKNQANPYQAVVYNQNIYGLGTAHSKIDLLCKLEALSTYKETAHFSKLEPVVLATFGHETGMKGIKKYIKEFKKRTRFALVGEASDLKILHTSQGFAKIEIVFAFSQDELKLKNDSLENDFITMKSKLFHGVAAHSSTPQLGESAIKKLFEYITQLPEDIFISELEGGTSHNIVPSSAYIEFGLGHFTKNNLSSKLKNFYTELKNLEDQFHRFHDDRFQPPYTTVNVGKITTNSDQIVLLGSCRLLPGSFESEYENIFLNFKKAIEAMGGQLKITHMIKPFGTSLQSSLVQELQVCLNCLKLDTTPGVQSTTNECSLLSRFGVECIAFGPGFREHNVYTSQEHVPIEHIDKAIEFYRLAIQRMCV